MNLCTFCSKEQPHEIKLHGKHVCFDCCAEIWDVVRDNIRKEWQALPDEKKAKFGMEGTCAKDSR